jgi:AcrR family transcriptional regulator
VSRTSLDDGRINQKLRTRAEILQAAQRVLARGVVPSADEIAAEASISRATLYRYFPNLDVLLFEAPLDEKAGGPDEVFAEALKDESASAADRVAQVQRYLYDLVADNEPRFRMFLKASMEQWLQTRGVTREPRRGARRLAMLEKALEPVRDSLDKPARERLIYALAALMSVESFIAMTDVCQLDRKKGREVITWAVRLLTEAALKESGRSSTAKKTLRR